MKDEARVQGMVRRDAETIRFLWKVKADSPGPFTL